MECVCRLRLVLMMLLALPAIILGALIHTLVSHKRVATSLYLIYGLLFRCGRAKAAQHTVHSCACMRSQTPAAAAAK